MPDHFGWLSILAHFLLKLLLTRKAPGRDRGSLSVKAGGFELDWRWDRDNRPPRR